MNTSTILYGLPSCCLLVIGAGTYSSASPAAGQCLPVQEDKLTADDGDSFDRFGIYVSISGDRALVGAYLDAPGGSAYVFVRDGEQWLQEDKLISETPGAGDWFGVSVSIDGDRALIGAQNDDDAGTDAGAAYIFERESGSNWTQITKLVPSQASSIDWAGHAVALDGDRAIVSAQLDDEHGTSAGAAYIFERDTGGTWVEAAKLTASDAAAGDEFGTSVAINGDVAVVGGRFDDNPFGGIDAGSAYVFRRTPDGQWLEEAKLLPADLSGGDEFGFAVAVDQDTVIVGSRLEDTNGENAGAAYVFCHEGGGTWAEEAKLLPSDGEPDDRFGESVSISDTRVIIGSRQDDDAGSNSGSAYVFHRDADRNWSELAKLTADDAAAGDFFGISVSVDGSRAIAGANLDSDSGDQSGSAYVFNLDPLPTLPADFDCSGVVDVQDLLQLLASWGPCRGCVEDLDRDDAVGTSDLLELLSAWGDAG